MVSRIKVLFFALLFAASHVAAESSAIPTAKQHLLDTHFDFRPSKITGIPYEHVEINAPISVYTRADGSIWGFQVGDKEIPVILTDRDGQTSSEKIISPSIPLSWASKGDFNLIADVPVLGKLDALYVDARQVDPKLGGKLKVRYIKNPGLKLLFMDSNHELSVSIVRRKNKWICVQEDGSPFISASVKTGGFGLGLNYPEFETLDPNTLIDSAMGQKEIKIDRSTYESAMTEGLKNLKTFMESPVEIQPGLSIQLKTSASPADFE